MAESKRNSVAGKVATPKLGGQPATSSAPMMDQYDALAKAIGAKVKLTTAAPHGQTYEGYLFTACPTLNIVAINTRTSSPNELTTRAGDYRIIPVTRIQQFQIMALPSSAEAGNSSLASAQPPIGPVDSERLLKQEQAKITKLKEEERDRGKGVSKEAQAIFDSFKRINMPVRWHNQQMIVHDSVIIVPPYAPGNCSAQSNKQEVLSRVRKVLDGERRKIQEREEKEQKAAAAQAGPRKGG